VAKKRLGKGIDALLQGRDLEQMEHLSSVVSVPIERLKPNPHQPRKSFSDETLAELTDSVREKGIIQPILAEEQDDGSYLIIAGERRYRAAEQAGLELVPVLPREFTDEEKLEIALVENLHREDLNPIEQAHALHSLMETAGLTQEELSQRLGMNRSTIANALRLLKLPMDIQQQIIEGSVSPGHARAILSVDDEKNRELLVQRISQESISVREAENVAAALNAGVYTPPTRRGDDVGAQARSDGATGAGQDAADSSASGTSAQSKKRRGEKDPELKAMEDRFLKALGTKVVIKGSTYRGRLEIDYFSMDDLERLYQLIVGSEGEHGGGA
jgi:ParB family chromosome partitioning protein